MMAVPNNYRINVARQDGIGWNGKPSYKWFCTIEAGNWLDHAKKVAEAARDLFPAPEFELSLIEDFDYSKTVRKFGERE